MSDTDAMDTEGEAAAAPGKSNLSHSINFDSANSSNERVASKTAAASELNNFSNQFNQPFIKPLPTSAAKPKAVLENQWLQELQLKNKP